MPSTVAGAIHASSEEDPRGSRRAGRGTIVCCPGRGGASVFREVRAESPLRFLLPKPAGCTAAAVCFGSFGGGLVGGDELDIDLRVHEGATLLATTQASTKAFRGHTRQNLRAEIDGTLILLPDPVSCFAGAHYRGRVDIVLGDAASLILVDAFTSGRAAYGERWRFAHLTSRIHIARGEKPILRDSIVLDEAHGDIATRFSEVDAWATVIAMGPRADAIAHALLAPSRGGLLYAPSALPTTEGTIVRILGKRTESIVDELRVRLSGLRELCGIDPYAFRW